MLPKSKLYNFFDSQNGFSISFLDGQKIIEELAILHNFKPNGFSFFRDSVLSSLLLINYLKPQENMGFFVDSIEPYFRLKIEMNYDGFMRSILLPEHFDQNPNSFSGNVRLIKLMPHSSSPYQSILAVKDSSLKDLVNMILSDSYQMNSRVVLSEKSDQSLLISRLPNINIDKTQSDERISLENYWGKISKSVADFFETARSNQDEIESFFKTLNFELLTSKEVVFKCNCSRDRMLTGVASVASSSSIENLFEEKQTLEAKCDYCQTTYEITKEEIERIINNDKH